MFSVPCINIDVTQLPFFIIHWMFERRTWNGKKTFHSIMLRCSSGKAACLTVNRVIVVFGKVMHTGRDLYRNVIVISEVVYINMDFVEDRKITREIRITNAIHKQIINIETRE